MQFYSARQLKFYCQSRKNTVQKWVRVIVDVIELVVLYVLLYIIQFHSQLYIRWSVSSV